MFSLLTGELPFIGDVYLFFFLFYFVKWLIFFFFNLKKKSDSESEIIYKIINKEPDYAKF
jgi:hypothetical protein